MKTPIKCRRTTPLYLLGDVNTGWVLYVDGSPLLEFGTYDDAARMLADMEEHFREIADAEAEADALQAEEDQRHERIERAKLVGAL